MQVQKAAGRQDEQFNNDIISKAMLAWGKHLDQVKPEISIQGSPERCTFRTAVTDTDGKTFILEVIPSADYDKKLSIGRNLDTLHRKGLPVVSYLPGLNGSTLQEISGHFWQLSVFIESEELDRLTYWQEGWRGEALADFIADLYLNTQDENWSRGPGFSLPSYIDRLTNTINRRRPALFKEISPVLDVIKNKLYPVYDSIPQRFSHGDPHPMNVLWGKDRIKAVIDWEFSGLRPVLYDAALITGCVASEAPEALESSFIKTFFKRIRTRKIFSPEQYKLLPLFIVAQRFAWLSEWLRHNDTEMIEFECFYMDHLLNSNLNQLLQ